MFLFMFNERGEYEGWQGGAIETDIPMLRSQKVRFVVVEDRDQHLLTEKYYVPNPEAGYSKWILAKRPKFEGKLPKVQVVIGEEIVVEGLPTPCTIRIDGEAYTIEDGSAELTFDVAGTYKIELDTWPYMPWVKSLKVVKP